MKKDRLERLVLKMPINAGREARCNELFKQACAAAGVGAWTDLSKLKRTQSDSIPAPHANSEEIGQILALHPLVTRWSSPARVKQTGMARAESMPAFVGKLYTRSASK